MSQMFVLNEPNPADLDYVAWNYTNEHENDDGKSLKKFNFFPKIRNARN